MSQPPPPPGFGPPETSPSGFGPPVTPPPGFGPPVTPPPFLAAPPPPPGPDPRPPLSRLRWILAAVVALALLAGGGIWLGVAGGDDGSAADGKQQDVRFDAPGTEKKPADTKAGLLFSVADPKVGKSDFHPAPGSWVTDEAYVKTGVGKVVAYDLKSGRQLWEIALGGQICGYTQHVDEGRTGILFQDALPGEDGKVKPCTEVAALDLNAGMLLWRGSVRRSGTKIAFHQVGMAAGKVAVAGDNGGAAFDLAGGDLLWEPKPTEPCYDMAYGSGEDLVALQHCGQEGNERIRLQHLGRGAKPRFTYDLPRGLAFAKIVSSDPLVVAGFNDKMAVTDYFAIDRRKGTLRSKIAVDPARTKSGCRMEAQTECSSLAVGNDRLYLATAPRAKTGASESVNEIVSYDLETGKATGQRADSGGKAMLFPLRMDGRDVLAYRTPLHGSPGQVVRIDGRTFEQEVFLSVPPDSEGAPVQRHFASDKVEIRYTSGRLFLAELYIRQPYSATEPPYLAAAFEAGAPR
ncbi:PQQ-binding-like beta-propeller repeat protein [Streptomyces sp. TRM66268-LWL]|uniref:PQQ-binding-like beta-propeller repeat protein n=1 Tax=Streptomyces polyasparticus TaxID=2767826 RepID=A0ABR7SBJ4_9ACTN|nr:PQQ-binding-like beta-propeller repeat protein [Streptomyces polyasparticus]MBC9712830.1 PQQ-binding-like beta-propeller repeat protein [Streptomyces polyasparticus]